MSNGIFRFPKRKTVTLLTLAGLIFFLPSLCSSAPKIKVFASLFPLQEFVRHVGGEWVQADLLLPPGAEPHTWEPKPSELAKLTKADLFVCLGPVMEPWVGIVLKAATGTRLKILEASQGLALLEAKAPDRGGTKGGAPHGADPHVWLDFSQGPKILERIAAALEEKDQAHGPQFRANASGYATKLRDLDRRYQASLARCRHRQLILGGHSAFAYLAHRYGLQQVALYGVNPNSEPTPKKLAAVIAVARERGAKTIFFERLVNPKLAQVLAKEVGIGTRVLNDGANLTREQRRKNVTFLELMEENLENLREGLACESP